jgi:hypothetical protein
LIRRVCGGPFAAEYVASTSDVTERFQWKAPNSGAAVTVEICEIISEDAEGQSSFISRREDVTYARASGVIVVVDLRRRDTLAVAEKMIAKMPSELCVLVLGTARDAASADRNVHPEDLESLARNAARTRSGHVQSLTVSLVDCYGLKVLHKYLDIPWLTTEAKNAEAALSAEKAEAAAREARLSAAADAARTELKRAAAETSLVYASNASAKEYDEYLTWWQNMRAKNKAAAFKKSIGETADPVAAAMSEVEALRRKVAELEAKNGAGGKGLDAFLQDDDDDDDSSSAKRGKPAPARNAPAPTQAQVQKKVPAALDRSALADFNPTAGKSTFFDEDDDDDDVNPARGPPTASKKAAFYDDDDDDGGDVKSNVDNKQPSPSLTKHENSAPASKSASAAAAIAAATAAALAELERPSEKTAKKKKDKGEKKKKKKAAVEDDESD